MSLTPVARLARHLAMDRMGSRLEKVVPVAPSSMMAWV